MAHQAIARLGCVLDLHRLGVGSDPTTEQGLAALAARPAGIDAWNGPYLKGGKSPLDPWNRAYVYRDPSVRQSHDDDLCSGGPDAVAGEPGTAGMICNP